MKAFVATGIVPIFDEVLFLRVVVSPLVSVVAFEMIPGVLLLMMITSVRVLLSLESRSLFVLEGRSLLSSRVRGVLVPAALVALTLDFCISVVSGYVLDFTNGHQLVGILFRSWSVSLANGGSKVSRQVCILEEVSIAALHRADASRLDEFVQVLVLAELLLEEEVGLLQVLDVVVLHLVHAHGLLQLLGQLVQGILIRLVASRVVTASSASHRHVEVIAQS